MKRWCIGAAVVLCLGLTGTAQAAGPPTQLTVGDQARPLNVEGTPQFGWMPDSSQGQRRPDRLPADGLQGRGRRCGTAARSRPPRSPTSPTAGPRSPTARPTTGRQDLGPRRRGLARGDAARFETGLTDSGWSGANWIRRVTNGNDSTDDWTLARKQFPALSGSPVTRARVYASAMGQYDVHVNGKTIGRGDNFNYPTEGQYYAFDATDAVKAGQPLALGALYHYWTCTCQGRANGPVVEHDAVRRAGRRRDQPQGRLGQRLRRRRPDHGRHGRGRRDRHGHRDRHRRAPTGTGITVTPALTQAHASGQAVLDHAGPSGLIMKAVVDHADGTRETFVTDGTWKIQQGRRSTRRPRSRPATATPATAPSATTRAPEIAGWDTAGFDDSAWQPAYAIGPHPRPLNPLRETFSHLDPAISHLDYETVKPEVAHHARRRQRRRRLRPGHLGGAADRASRTASPAARS